MVNSMKILISNDDGIHSPGIVALAEIARSFGEVRIVAPDFEQSAKSHSITVTRPLHYYPTDMFGDLEAFRVDGTPADCVAIGAYHWGKIDLVLSGINLGLNIGHNIWHSGTVAAAKQAVFWDIPAIAFSAPFDSAPTDYSVFESYLRDTISMFLEQRDLFMLNVNFPREPKGILWTRQSVRHYEGVVVPGFAERPKESVEEGTDRWAIERGYVSLTPLRIDLTDESHLRRAQKEVAEASGVL
jgi:5'-nucleotidase